MSLQQRLRDIRHRVDKAAEAAGRDPASVTLVAVSKRQPDERLQAAYAAGQRDFGENFVQELERKRELLPDDVRWHLIGHLQTNKAKRIVDKAFVHSLDSLRLARTLSKAALAAERTVTALVEVNLAAEAQKTGVSPSQVEELVRTVDALGGVQIVGLMCIPPVGSGTEYFPRLVALKNHLEEALGRPLPELSMGMSADFEAAIAAGSTMVRVGTSIFGPRYPA